MLEAEIRIEEEKLDFEMQVVAWQTALLMNSTGNYKKQIKPTDLYKSVGADRNKKVLSEEEIRLEKERKREELLKAFAGSEINIK